MPKRQEQVKELRGRARKFSFMLLKEFSVFYNLDEESPCEEGFFNNEAIPLFYLFDELLQLAEKEEYCFQLLLSVVDFIEEFREWGCDSESDTKDALRTFNEIVFYTHKHSLEPLGVSTQRCKDRIMEQPRQLGITGSFEYLFLKEEKCDV